MGPRIYTVPPGYHESNGHGQIHGHGLSDDKRIAESGEKESKKKRPQELVLQGQNGSSSAVARRQSTSKQAKTEPAAADIKPTPSVLVREKKQVSQIMLQSYV
jgi:hypothetical protein